MVLVCLGDTILAKLTDSNLVYAELSSSCYTKQAVREGTGCFNDPA